MFILLGPLTLCADILKTIAFKFPKSDATLEICIEVAEEEGEYSLSKHY